MPDFRREQIERAQRALTQPDLTASPARRALSERIARHVLGLSGTRAPNVISIFEARVIRGRGSVAMLPGTGGDAA